MILTYFRTCPIYESTRGSYVDGSHRSGLTEIYSATILELNRVDYSLIGLSVPNQGCSSEQKKAN